MRWTTTLPTVSGHYWCKCRGELSGNIYDTIVKVTIQKNGTPTVFWDGETYFITHDAFTRWSDQPITPPQE